MQSGNLPAEAACSPSPCSLSAAAHPNQPQTTFPHRGTPSQVGRVLKNGPRPPPWSELPRSILTPRMPVGCRLS